MQSGVNAAQMQKKTVQPQNKSLRWEHRKAKKLFSLLEDQNKLKWL